MLTKEQKIDLLEKMREQVAVTEDDIRVQGDLSWFYPNPNYRRVHEPDNFLVVGGRGSGKSALFAVMSRDDSAIKEAYPNLYPADSVFLKGFDNDGQRFPTEEVIKAHVNNTDKDSVSLFWQGLLLYVLWGHFSADAIIINIFTQYFGNDLSAKMPTAAQTIFWMTELSASAISNALDALDIELQKRNKDIYILYDYLDRIYIAEYNAAIHLATSLLALWLNRNKRWRCIRAKIFLRRDIYEKAQEFPDASKLSGHVVELKWNDIQLYSMWIKRFANASIQAYEYCNLTENLIKNERSTIFGYIPNDDKEIQKAFVERLIGQFMGTNAKKGYTYPWIVDKVSDAQSIALPRSFIKFFTEASGWMLENSEALDKLENDRLLLPKAFMNALDQVSTERLAELREEYGQWISDLKDVLTGMLLPVAKEELLDRIGNMDTLSIVGNPEKMLNLLQSIGIIEKRYDQRLSMPWIYRRGFGVKSRGGVGR